MRTKKGRMPETYEPGEQNFHYNREEREVLLSEDAKRLLSNNSKFFSINKRNLIVLADILFIIIISIIFVPLSASGRRSAKIDGFKADLNAYEYNSTVLVSLKVYALDDAPVSGIVSASFSVDNNEVIADMDILPTEKDKPRILRAEFPADDNMEKKMFCRLDINGNKKTLTAKIKKE